MHSKIALPPALLALVAAGAGCNLIFGIEPGTEAPASSSSSTAASAPSGTGGSAPSTSSSGGDGGAGGDAGGGAGGDAGGGMPSCAPSSCTAGSCPVTQMAGQLGMNPKGMAVIEDAVLLANGEAIMAIPKDGGAARALPGTPGFGDASWVTYSGGQLSWINWSNGNVLGISIDPPSSSPIQIAAVPQEGGDVYPAYGRIAAFGDSVYWVTQVPQAVWRARADGSQRLAEQVASGGNPMGIAVDATHVYWSDYLASQILRKTKDPLGATAEVFAATNGNPTEVLLAKGSVYWVSDNTGAVQSKATDAALDDPPFTYTADGQAIPKSVAVDDEFVYWTVQENAEGQGEVRRAHIGRGDMTTLTTGEPYFFELAIDCGSIYWTLNNLEADEEAVVFTMPKPSN